MLNLLKKVEHYKTYKFIITYKSELNKFERLAKFKFKKKKKNHHKTPMFLKDVDTEKALVSNKISYFFW